MPAPRARRRTGLTAIPNLACQLGLKPRRQFLPPDKLDAIAADPRGPFRKLPKAEFEEKVRLAADAQELARTPPRLVATAYTGRYAPGSVSGSAEWAVLTACTASCSSTNARSHPPNCSRWAR